MAAPLTFVSAFFDLGKREKSNRRPASEYLKHGRRLCEIDVPMILFVDPDYVQAIREMRKGRESITRVIGFEFYSLPYFARREQVERNRRENPIAILNREKDTVDYQVLNWAKLWFLRRAIEESHFNSSHYAWHDFGLAHVAKMDRALGDGAYSDLPDKIRYARIRAVDRRLMDDRAAYLRTFRWNFAGGFFKGPKELLLRFHDSFDSLLDRVLNAGHAPLEQELFSLVVHRQPEDFDPYYGDYGSLLENYRYLRSDLPIVLLHVQEAANFQDKETVCRIGQLALRSSLDGQFGGSMSQLERLLDSYFTEVYYRDRSQAETAARQYARLVHQNAEFRRAFSSHADRVKKNFSHLGTDVFAETEVPIAKN